MKTRNYKDPSMARVYNHYRTTDEVTPNVSSSDRRHYWFGRFGHPAQAARNTMAYACWAAGADRYHDEGAPDITVTGVMGNLMPADSGLVFQKRDTQCPDCGRRKSICVNTLSNCSISPNNQVTDR